MILHLTDTQFNSVNQQWEQARLAKQLRDTHARTYDAIKDSWANLYLQSYHEMFSPNGLLIATYKPQERKSFNEEGLKKKYPEIHAEFDKTKVSTIRSLLIK